MTHAQATLQRIHRTTIGAAVGRTDPVLHRQQALGILGGHAEDAGQPAPQHSAGTAQGYGRGYADDIAGAYRGGQRRGQRAKLADVALGARVFLHR